MIANSVDNTNVYHAFPPGVGGWIGLYRVPWKWADNSNSSFRNWLTGNPDNYMGNQFCITENNQHLWDDENCESQCVFLCEGGELLL